MNKNDTKNLESLKKTKTNHTKKPLLHSYLEDLSIDFAQHKELLSLNLFVPTCSFLLVEIGQHEQCVNEHDCVITSNSRNLDVPYHHSAKEPIFTSNVSRVSLEISHRVQMGLTTGVLSYKLKL